MHLGGGGLVVLEIHGTQLVVVVVDCQLMPFIHYRGLALFCYSLRVGQYLQSMRK